MHIGFSFQFLTYSVLHSTPSVEASEIMRSIGEAVEFLHGINIAHRDLKVSYTVHHIYYIEHVG